MKKIFLLACAALICATGYVSAQQKVNSEALMKKVEKSDADIANPKKNGKAATWVARGNVLTEVGAAPTANLFKQMTDQQVKDAYGNNPEVTVGKIENKEYTIYVYPDFKVYMNVDGLVVGWEQTTVVMGDAFEKAYEAYAKAYELDNRVADEVKKGMDILQNEYKKRGDNIYLFHKYEEAADDFAKAYDIQLHPAVNFVDAAIAYNAGLFYTMAMKFDKGEPFLEKAIQNGYPAEGDAYYFLYYCYFGQNRPDEAMKILEDGLAKFPNNPSIIEGLVTLYNNIEGKDPTEIIPKVEEAIKKEPNNHLLWSGLGGVYEKLNMYDKSIGAYLKSVELAPDDFVNNYKLGVAYYNHGNFMADELNKNSMTTSREEYNQAVERVMAEFMKSIAPLEKAHEIRPNELAPVALLKTVTFRLREQPDVNEKHTKYDELYKKMQGQ